MVSDNIPINNLIKVGKTVKIPIYSSVRLIDGEIIGELEGYEELPAELLPNNDYEH